MKKNLLKTLFAGAFLSMLFPLTASADVEINETNFPDEYFRNYLLEQDYGQDGIITDEEIAGITSINVFARGLSSLKGIEYFMALTSLSCSDNQLTSLDVSRNTALTKLQCERNQLTSLDVSKNTALTFLLCSYNQLTSLDVSNNTALENLYCYGNQLTSLDVSNTALKYMGCYLNQIKGASMDALIKGLPINESSMEYQLFIYTTSTLIGNDGNVCTRSQIADIKAKGWTPYYSSDLRFWFLYEGNDDDLSSIAKPIIGTENANTPVYNLSGQKVANVKKGIYIVNGHKVVIK